MKILSALLLAMLATDSATAQTARPLSPDTDTQAVSQLATATKRAEAADDDNGLSLFFTEYLKDRVRIGTRLGGRLLIDSDSGHKGGTYGSGTYLGTIYALEEKNTWLPNKPFLAYSLTRYLEIEAAYDTMTSATLATDSDSGVEKTDGDAVLAGPTISLIAKYPNDFNVVPYIGLGLGFFNGDFLETEDWAHSDWGTSQRDRLMVVDSSIGLLLTAGLSWNFSDHWSLDCSLQYVKTDSDATFYGYTDGVLDTEQSGHFPFDNFAMRLGMAYTF